jgi:hypothetical protein
MPRPERRELRDPHSAVHLEDLERPTLNKLNPSSSAQTAERDGPRWPASQPAYAHHHHHQHASVRDMALEAMQRSPQRSPHHHHDASFHHYHHHNQTGNYTNGYNGAYPPAVGPWGMPPPPPSSAWGPAPGQHAHHGGYGSAPLTGPGGLPPGWADMPRPAGLPEHIPWPPPPPPPGWTMQAPHGAFPWPPPPPPSHRRGGHAPRSATDSTATEDYSEEEDLPPPPPARSGGRRYVAAAGATRTRTPPASARQQRTESPAATTRRQAPPPGRTPSQLEVDRIRSLGNAASGHFIGGANAGRSSRSRSPQAPEDFDAREEAYRRRRELLESNRRNADNSRRSTTPGATTRRRSTTPTVTAPLRAARHATPSLRELKGELPDVQRALREGIPPHPRHQAQLSRSTASGFHHGGPNASAAGAGGSLSALDATTQAQAQEYLRGIQDLYHRMRDSYVQFRQHPEEFLARGPPPSSSAAAASRVMSPPRASAHASLAAERSYVPLRFPPTPSAEPSAEARKLRDELDRLERQWERLDSRRGAFADGDTDGGGGSDVPRTREGVLDKLHTVLGRAPSAQ